MLTSRLCRRDLDERVLVVTGIIAQLGKREHGQLYMLSVQLRAGAAASNGWR